LIPCYFAGEFGRIPSFRGSCYNEKQAKTKLDYKDGQTPPDPALLIRLQIHH
jgi:hypothetical protein